MKIALLPRVLKKALIFLFWTSFGSISVQAQTLVETSRVLFHAGARPILEQDIQANTVPEAAWEHFIMGTRTAFDLPEFRRGLYGAEGVYGTGLYATYALLAGKEPWLMMIEVRKECLSDSNLFHSDYSVKTSAPETRKKTFSQWYLARASELQTEASVCLKQYSDQPAYWQEGALYSLADADAALLAETRTCTPVLNRFLNDMKFKVVRDVVNDNSWYIRDRSCIQSIKGTPDQIFTAIVENKIGNSEDLLSKNLLGDPVDPSQASAGTLYIFLKVLAETSYLDNAHLPQLLHLARNFDGISLERVRKDSDDISFASSADSEAFVVAALSAATASIQTKTQRSFQKQLHSLLTGFLQKLGPACQGSHGVLAQNRVACRQVTDLESQKILKFLLSYSKVPSSL